jgi:hypothetical protein
MAAQHSEPVVSSTAPHQPDARLDGARLAARGIAHALRNDLTQVLGRLSLVAIRADLSPAARADLLQAEAALRRTERHLDEFQHIVRIVTRDTPDGPLLDMDLSLTSDPPTR